jgi:hypothetical protein
MYRIDNKVPQWTNISKQNQLQTTCPEDEEVCLSNTITKLDQDVVEGPEETTRQEKTEMCRRVA